MKRFFKKKFVITVAAGLITAGLVGTLPAIYFSSSNNGSVAKHALAVAASTPVKNQPLVTGPPVAISISSVNINLPLVNGYYNPKTREWTLSSDKAQFATPTVQPNNLSGNTFIYGHALANVFGRLDKIQPGDKATVTTSNGYVFSYKFTSTYATQPTDLSVLHYQGSPILSLQTCSGSWYQNRQMYLFSFVDYKKV
jgi:LPXTG-site transpeptidase (sortase) family protein